MGYNLVCTAPHRERAVVHLLTVHGVPHHWFREMRQVVSRGQVVWRPRSLFSGYVFAMVASDQFDAVREILGVIGFVMLGDRIAVVNDRVVEALVRASVNDIMPIQIRPPVSRFNSGDRVLIQGASMLAGQVGVYQRMIGEHEAVVEIDAMGRYIAMPVDERDLSLDVVRKRRRRRRRWNIPHGRSNGLECSLS